MTLFSAPSYAKTLSLEEQAAQKAQYYRDIITQLQYSDINIIEVVNTVMIADAYSTSLVYKSFSSLIHCVKSTSFSYYSGW